ncbi:hypothetical protein D3C87_189590 [compost metagenome]
MRWFSLVKTSVGFLILGSVLASCTFRKDTEKKDPVPMASMSTPAPKAVAVKEVPKDKILQGIVRLFEQADSIHREAWWVIAGDRRPFGKSPFGKVQRALMSSQGLKLPNKSAFRCDRYVVKRDVLSAVGYPQKAEIYEKCSDKAPAKQIADWSLEKVGELKVTFHTENLEEVLGLGPTIMIRRMECRFEYNDMDQLTLFNCKDWAQERSKSQLVRLDTYEYRKDKKSLLKLRGKVYEDLSEIRKIEVDIPLEGKIKITETELYAPEEPKVAATPTPSAIPAPIAAPGKAGAVAPGGAQGGAPGGAPQAGGLVQQPQPQKRAPVPGSEVDPDLLMMQQRAQGGGAGVEMYDEQQGPEAEGEQGEGEEQAQGVPHEGPGLLMAPTQEEEGLEGQEPQEGHAEFGPVPGQPQQEQGVPHGR